MLSYRVLFQNSTDALKLNKDYLRNEKGAPRDWGAPPYKVRVQGRFPARDRDVPIFLCSNRRSKGGAEGTPCRGLVMSALYANHLLGNGLQGRSPDLSGNPTPLLLYAMGAGVRP
jgi:hypothetical protein